MDEPLEARPQRLRHHLRRLTLPHRSMTTARASYTINRTVPVNMKIGMKSEITGLLLAFFALVALAVEAALNPAVADASEAARKLGAFIAQITIIIVG